MINKSSRSSIKIFVCLISTLILTSCSPQIKREFIGSTNKGYSKAVVITTKDTKTVYISGQTGRGETLEVQMKAALEKIFKLIKECGGTQKDIVKLNTFIVDYKPSDLEVFRRVRKEIMGDSNMPASTLVGVQSLALPHWKIEIDAIVVIARD